MNPPPGEPRISARTAAVLARDPALRRLRVRYRTDREIYDDLRSLALAGYAYEAATGNATGNATGIVIDSSAADDCLMTTARAAELCGITANAIRRAAREGRLDARRPAGRWQIPAASAARYAEGLADG